MQERYPKVLIVAANPNSDALTLAAARHCASVLGKKNITNRLLHLDNSAFDPNIPLQEIQRRASFHEVVLEHQKLIQNCKTMALFYPDWYGMPPAILIGWLQRIFSPGIAFEYSHEEFPPRTRQGLLHTLSVLLAVSTDEEYSEPDPLSYYFELIKKRLFFPCAIRSVHTIALYNTYNSSQKERKQWLQSCSDYCSNNTHH